jgi:hypothetical protein
MIGSRAAFDVQHEAEWNMNGQMSSETAIRPEGEG